MIKTLALLALLLVLYGLAGRLDFETAVATAQERASCPPCPCEELATPSPTWSRLKRSSGCRRSFYRSESAHRIRTAV